MSTAQPVPWKYLKTTILHFAPFWGCATLLFGGLGMAYSLVKTDTWEASQPLLLRDEATGSVQRLGRFAGQTELIAAQETILEMARNRQVVEAALELIGPPEDAPEGHWPSSRIVEDVATEQINIRAPKTSEFGKTEVVYLVTKADSPERAERLCAAVYSALTEHLRMVRCVRADSVVAELISARDLARQNLDEATAELQRLEASVGMDLGELRGLSESLSGEASSSRVLSEVQRDLRIAELELQKVETLHALLQRGYDDPQHLLISDGDILATQPTLQRLKAGLIDSQLAASQLAGQLTPEHPRMFAAELAQETIREELRKEILSVNRSMGPSLQLAREKVSRLRDKEQDIKDKLAQLATIRTEYAQRVSAVKHRNELMSQSQAALAEAEASRSASLSTNLLSELGPPRAGENPVGPGGTMITAGSLVAGMLFGFGGVFLVAPGPVGTGGTSLGRRWSDRIGGRRANDVPPSVPFASRQSDTPVAIPPTIPPGPTSPALGRRSDDQRLATAAPIRTTESAQVETDPVRAETAGSAEEPRAADVQTSGEVELADAAPADNAPPESPEELARISTPEPFVDTMTDASTSVPAVDVGGTVLWSEEPLNPQKVQGVAKKQPLQLPFQDVSAEPN